MRQRLRSRIFHHVRFPRLVVNVTPSLLVAWIIACDLFCDAVGVSVVVLVL